METLKNNLEQENFEEQEIENHISRLTDETLSMVSKFLPENVSDIEEAKESMGINKIEEALQNHLREFLLNNNIDLSRLRETNKSNEEDIFEKLSVSFRDSETGEFLGLTIGGAMNEKVWERDYRKEVQVPAISICYCPPDTERTIEGTKNLKYLEV